MPTIETIAESVAAPLGEEYSDFDIKRSFDLWTAEGLDEVLHSEEWPFLRVLGEISTTATQQTYVAPDGIWDVLRVGKADEAPLSQTTREELMDDGRDPLEAGTPTAWFPAGVNTSSKPLIGLWPVPNTADVDYYVLGGTMSNVDADSPTTSLAIPPDIIRLVRHLVREQYFATSGDPTTAQVERGKYYRALSDARRRHMNPGDIDRTAEWRDIPRIGSHFLTFPNSITSS
jgi:hypothetical protein